MRCVMKYKCKRCNEYLESKEFHYKEFESLSPKKVCWECEKKAIEDRVMRKNEEIITQKDEIIKSLTIKLEHQKKLTNGVQSISFDKSMVRDGLLKHKNLNVYMHKNNPDEAYFQMKGKFRKYKPVQSKYGPEMCIVVKSGYVKKWYKLSDMHGWIMGEGETVKAFS